MQDTNSLQIDAAAEETPQFLSSRQRKQAARQILARICLSLLILATSVFCLVVLFFGPVRAFGKELSAITAVNFILAILQIQKGIIYETLVKLFLGLMYFGFMIVMLKNFIQAIRFCCVALSSKLALLEPKQQVNTLGRLYNCGTSSLYKLVCLLVVSYLFCGETLLPVGWVILIVCAIVPILGAALIAFPTPAVSSIQNTYTSTWNDFFFALLRQVAAFAFAACLAYFLLTPAASDLYYDLQVLFGGYASGTKNIVRLLLGSVVTDLLILIAILSFLSLLKSLFSSYPGNFGYEQVANTDLKHYSLRILILIAVTALILCVLQILALGTEIELTRDLLLDWFSLLRDYHIPVILASLAGISISVGMSQQ